MQEAGLPFDVENDKSDQVTSKLGASFEEICMILARPPIHQDFFFPQPRER